MNPPRPRPPRAGRSSAPGLVTLALLAALAAGCTRTVTFRRGSVEARGVQQPFGSPAFHFVAIGLPDQPWDGRHPEFVLELPGGRLVASGALTAELVRSLGGRKVLSEVYRTGQQGWPRGVEEVDLEPFYFVLLGDRVVAVEAGMFPGAVSVYTLEPLSCAPPAIGEASGAAPYRFPLSLAQLTTLFGEPETLRKGIQK